MSGQRIRCDGHMSPLALMSATPATEVTGALCTAISVLPEGEDGARTSGFGRYVSAWAKRPFIAHNAASRPQPKSPRQPP
jgi:hypothetical protein